MKPTSTSNITLSDLLRFALTFSMTVYISCMWNQKREKHWWKFQIGYGFADRPQREGKQKVESSLSLYIYILTLIFIIKVIVLKEKRDFELRGFVYE